MRRLFLLFLLFISTATLSGCDDLLTGNVARDAVQRPPSVYIRCDDQTGFTILDYCTNSSASEFKILIANNRFGTIDSMEIALSDAEENTFEKSVDMNLEPSFNRIFTIEYPDKIGVPSEMTIIGNYISSSGMISTCNRRHITFKEVRECGG